MKPKEVASEEIASGAIGGQALFDMANLRPERTGLPFVVFVSQKKGGARHDPRVKLARAAKVRPSDMITVALRPTPWIIRGKINAGEFDLVKQWIQLNLDVLVDYWIGDIEYTEDALDLLRPVGAL